jgi:hypothetical protein
MGDKKELTEFEKFQRAMRALWAVRSQEFPKYAL